MPAAWWSPSRGGMAARTRGTPVNLLNKATSAVCSVRLTKASWGRGTLVNFIDKGLKFPHFSLLQSQAGMGLIPHRIMEKLLELRLPSLSSATARRSQDPELGVGLKKGGVGPEAERRRLLPQVHQPVRGMALESQGPHQRSRLQGPIPGPPRSPYQDQHRSRHGRSPLYLAYQPPERHRCRKMED